ncbi:hypothetical protein BOX15_Mlig031174g2 [Macrostomum lignano]|uniref:Methyltransferase domain-containing protein n=1 Tax=Macrostomum lignano TaxID=282301 RepID=A0A267EB56_9PLAT|nr:hypothetical protein BOX15_Mlig031174g2 [Macrostomum lignano]
MVLNISTKRSVFCALALFIAAVLVIITIRGGYHQNLHSTIRDYIDGKHQAVSTGGSGNLRKVETQQVSKSKSRGNKVYNFGNGRIAVGSSGYDLSSSKLESMNVAELEDLYESVVLETTADCSTERRFGRKGNGGWELCLVGPFTPTKPCFSYSFGVNNIWEFDDEVAATFRCQVTAFDPRMSQESHMRNDKVAFIKEGVYSKQGTLNGWSVDSYLGHLKRFGAENFIIDILKFDVESLEWPALETAVRDGSLGNVKQLLLETRIEKTRTKKNFKKYFSVLKSLYDTGFRQWKHNWKTNCNYRSSLNKDLDGKFCHELYYININFLTDDRPAQNPADLRVLPPFARFMISKAKNFNKANDILKTDLTSLTSVQLEVMYFGILEQVHVNCPYSMRIGGTADGGWDVCFSRPFNIEESKPCIAFSFGINNIWSYDDILADKYHCNVHMFDPSMNAKDHQRKTTSWFYRTGLSSENKVEGNGWKMRTLCTLFSELGYRNKKIDILKIDIEHWEWTSFEKAFSEGCLTNVKQLLFESHTSELVRQKSDYGRLIRVWQGLFKLGFRTWKWHKNPQSLFFKSAASPKEQRACCYEHYMLNTNLVDL